MYASRTVSASPIAADDSPVAVRPRRASGQGADSASTDSASRIAARPPVPMLPQLATVNTTAAMPTSEPPARSSRFATARGDSSGRVPVPDGALGGSATGPAALACATASGDPCSPWDPGGCSRLASASNCRRRPTSWPRASSTRASSALIQRSSAASGPPSHRPQPAQRARAAAPAELPQPGHPSIARR
ncbi:MAG: hypothetical protein QOJ73_2686 [Streptosporangiaceae bacterium]|nr:hypothetical protein [Streptosporangiaceae bacterium]